MKRDFEDVRKTEAYINNRPATKPKVSISFIIAIALVFQSKLKFIIIDRDYTMLILLTICLLSNVTTRGDSSKLGLDRYVPPGTVF